jgi:hypothetical protein
MMVECLEFLICVWEDADMILKLKATSSDKAFCIFSVKMTKQNLKISQSHYLPHPSKLSYRMTHITYIINSSNLTMALGSTQPLTEMSTRNLPGG